MDRTGPAPAAVREYVAELGGAGVDLERLRRAFAELMEAAAHDVQCAGYEQDDSIVERYVDLRYEGDAACLTIAAESLTDADRLLAPFHVEYARRFGRSFPVRPVEMVSARARCLIYGRPSRPV